MFGPIKEFRKKLQSGQFCVGIGITLADPCVCELLGPTADFFWIDLEHTPQSLESLQAHFIAARAVATPALVRVPGSDHKIIKRVLDTGAHGIIVPQVSSRDEAEYVVSSCRYPPEGSRGFGPRRAMDYGRIDVPTYFRHAREDVFVSVQIENVTAFHALDDIVTVPGLDSVVIGPYDLSVSMGKPGELEDPEVAQAFQTIVDRAREHGRFVGMGMPADEECALRAARIGVNWVQCGNDWNYMLDLANVIPKRIRSEANK